MVLIYSPVISPKLAYTTKLLFKGLLGVDYRLTNNRDVFLSANDARINYSNETISNSVAIKPNGFLNESTVAKTTPLIGKWGETITLFADEGKEIPFDIFSAVFFLTSRYEEYTEPVRDLHGRFAAKQSFSYKNNFLQLPLVNIWANKLRQTLNSTFNLNIEKAAYNYISTLDIDHVFYYKYKPLLRNILGGAKQLLTADFSNFAIRTRTLFSGTDPNDIYNWLFAEHEKHNTQSLFFFLLGDKNLPYDPTPIFHNQEVKNIIQDIAKKSTIGIHPSYNSFNNIEVVQKEKQRLEDITGQLIKHSRQHYLRFSLPETYRVLAACGIENEYSMGYADHVGYRAGIASPFNWFDLEKNIETSLVVHPFEVMDVTLKNYMQQSIEQAKETILQLNRPVQENGGTFMSLWHNESLSDVGQWKNWREVYQLLLTFSPKNGD